MRRRLYGFTAMMAMVSIAFTGLAWGQPAADRLITATSMGPATLGGAEADLAAQLGAGYTLNSGVTPFVDLEGTEVVQAGASQFWALYVAGAGPAFNVFITENAEYQLDSGIGPGATIAEAAAIYGEPTVSFNTNSESREFVTFASGPSGRIQLQVEGPDGAMAGNYDEPTVEFNETTDIKAGSVITRVWISCVGSECPAPGTLPETGLTDTAMPLAVLATFSVALGGLLVLTARRPARSPATVRPRRS